MAFRTIRKRKRVASLTSCVLTSNEQYVNEKTHSVDIKSAEVDVLSAELNRSIPVSEFSLESQLANGQPIKKVNTCVLDGVTAPPEDLLTPFINDESENS